MKTPSTFIVLTVLFLFALNAGAAQEDSTKVASQNPSPMTDSTRPHKRIEQKEYQGVTFEIAGLFPKPLQAFIPQKSLKKKKLDLLVHFHGAAYVTQDAATRYRGDIVAVTLNVGSGSKVYNDAFADTSRFMALIDSVLAGAARQVGHSVRLNRVILSGFSAGYGAIRRIIMTSANYARVDAVLLLDGIHASYVPERRVLAQGGRIDSTGLTPYLMLARDALSSSSRKRFLITHSEIFPGTFVSTTEATDYLINQLGLKRRPVLREGPLGMQQLSATRKGRFAVWGFAGNTAPDHVDHVQALSWFLNALMRL
jgi:hypothetical protein